MQIADIIINLVIFTATAVLMIAFSREDRAWTRSRLRVALRFFTCQSNILCAAGALLTAVAAMAGEVPRWIWTIKYIGTVAVTITMVTVFVYLAPALGKGWAARLITRPHDMIMHVITPVLAILSFCLLEKRGMSFAWSLWGMLPVMLYGPLYLYKIIHAKEEKRWDDFYGFNKNGKWKIAYEIMFVCSLLLCVIYWLVQNA